MIPSAYLEGSKRAACWDKGAFRLLASVFCARLDCATWKGADLDEGESWLGDGMLSWARARCFVITIFASSKAGCQHSIHYGD